MSIKTEITQEDFSTFVKHVARGAAATGADRTLRRFIAGAFGVGLGMILSLLHLSSHPSALAGLFCGFLAGAFVLLVVITTFSRRQMRRMRPSDDGYVVGAQEVFLEDEGIRQCSARHQSVFQWSLVRGVAVTDQHVFVMVDRIAGIILPIHAFSSDAECEQFVCEIERRSGKART